MAFIPAIDCAQVAVRGSQDSQACEFTIDAKLATPYTQADLDALSFAVDFWVGVGFLPLLASTAQYTGTEVRGLTSAIDLTSTNVNSVGSGANTGALAGAQLALVATKKTGFTGRSARGRLYFFGLVAPDLLDSRHVTAGVATAFTAAARGLVAAINGAGWQAVVVSKQHNGAIVSPAATYAITDILIQDTRIDTQRRRLGKF